MFYQQLERLFMGSPPSAIWVEMEKKERYKILDDFILSILVLVVLFPHFRNLSNNFNKSQCTKTLLLNIPFDSYEYGMLRCPAYHPTD